MTDDFLKGLKNNPPPPDPPSAFKAYRPSNGTEGSWFESQFCDRCALEDAAAEKWCDIHGSAEAFYTWEDGFPRDYWVYFNGKPTCLAFRERGGNDHKEPFEPDPAQGDLFTPLSVLTTVAP